MAKAAGNKGEADAAKAKEHGRLMDNRLTAAYWLIRSGGMLQVARKDAARATHRHFTSSNGPWITALGYTMATMAKAVDEGFVVRHKACGFGTVQWDDAHGRCCPNCLKTNLADADMEHVSLKGPEAKRVRANQ